MASAASFFIILYKLAIALESRIVRCIDVETTYHSNCSRWCFLYSSSSSSSSPFSSFSLSPSFSSRFSFFGQVRHSSVSLNVWQQIVDFPGKISVIRAFISHSCRCVSVCAWRVRTGHSVTLLPSFIFLVISLHHRPFFCFSFSLDQSRLSIDFTSHLAYLAFISNDRAFNDESSTRRHPPYLAANNNIERLSQWSVISHIGESIATIHSRYSSWDVG